MSARHRLFVQAVLALCAGVLVYGLWEGRLLAQPAWSEIGRQRFLLFAAVYATLAAFLLAWRPKWFVPAILGGATLYTLAATGPLALPATLFILLSAWCLGLGGLLPGLALLVTLISLTAALPVHYPSVYLVVLTLPILKKRTDVFLIFRRGLPAVFPETRGTAAAAALAAFPLLCHWLVALKPEVSADGLAMHLVIPARLAVDHRWSFDVGQFTWAVMPMGVDWTYAAGYLLGGEAAARLLNFAFLCLVALLLYQILRRWVKSPAALCMVALFLSSPLVQLVTGSLFVENLWTAMLLGGLLAIMKFRETRETGRLHAAALLLGTAVAMKLGALVFAMVLLLIAVTELFRKPSSHWPKTLLAMTAVFVAFACIPYVTAWKITGNPVFPFANTLFKSPLYDTATAWQDLRYKTPLSLATAYDATFHTARYLEGLGGGFTLHWIFLLPVAAAILGRRRWPWPAAPIMAGILFCFFVVLSGQAYLRYIYPLLPLAMIPLAIGWRCVDDRSLQASLAIFGGVTFCLNLWLLPASGWYHKDFFLNQVFDRGDVDRYLQVVAPARRIVDYLNRKPRYDFRVAFLEDNAIGDLRARAFSNTWHSDAYYRALQASGSPEDDLTLARRFRLDYFIGLNPDGSRLSRRFHTGAFLQRYTEPEVVNGPYELRRLKDHARTGVIAAVMADLPVALPETYDDTSKYLSFSGPWIRDTQFKEAWQGTIAYTAQAGSTASLRFSGTSVTWMFTRAFNRGMAEVVIDGASRGTVDLYATQTQWQSTARFDGLSADIHTITVRVTAGKNQAAQGTFVDVDQFTVAR